jgi:hypothetical protein
MYNNNPNGFALSLSNTSEAPIQVIWDETVVVTPDGSTSRVIHEGVKYIDMENAQPPSNIPPGARIDEYAGPTSKISYSDSSGWFEEGLFLEFSEGDSASLFLVLNVNGKRQNLNFKVTATQPFVFYSESSTNAANN